MLKLPFFEELEGSRRILLAGCDGGFDVFGALPLYFALKAEGREVHLASLSFSFPDLALPILSLQPGWRERILTPNLVLVDADTPEFAPYFPELFLSRWFRSRGEEVPLWCFPVSAARPLAASYRVLVERLGLDAVVLVDGGSDSLMRGDEEDLGTSSEDVASLVAVDSLDLPVKLLACIGFWADWFHGISHGRALEATAELAAAGGYLGLFSLLDTMPEARLYREDCAYVFERMPGNESIANTSILSALEGRFGNWQTLERTKKGRLWISPLMSAYWCYRLSAVTGRMAYPRDRLAETIGIMDLARVIIETNRSGPRRPRVEIPI